MAFDFDSLPCGGERSLASVFRGLADLLDSGPEILTLEASVRGEAQGLPFGAWLRDGILYWEAGGEDHRMVEIERLCLQLVGSDDDLVSARAQIVHTAIARWQGEQIQRALSEAMVKGRQPRGERELAEATASLPFRSRSVEPEPATELWLGSVQIEPVPEPEPEPLPLVRSEQEVVPALDPDLPRMTWEAGAWETYLCLPATTVLAEDLVGHLRRAYQSLADGKEEEWRRTVAKVEAVALEVVDGKGKSLTMSTRWATSRLRAAAEERKDELGLAGADLAAQTRVLEQRAELQAKAIKHREDVEAKALEEKERKKQARKTNQHGDLVFPALAGPLYGGLGADADETEGH